MYALRGPGIEPYPAGQVASVERWTCPGPIAVGQVVMGYTDTAYWLDVGTPAAYIQGSCDLVLGKLASPALPGPCGQALVLGGVTLAEGYALEGNSDSDVVLHAITNAISGITGKPILGPVADKLCRAGVTNSAV